MTDHADTIRRALQRLPEAEAIVALTPMPGGSGGPPPTRRGEALMALECLVAERQQAIDDVAGYRSELQRRVERCNALLAERQQAIDEAAKWKAEADSFAAAVAHASDLQDEAEARCEQAIDALLEIAKIEDSFQAQSRYTGTVATCFHDCPAMARAALVSLGEKPTP